MVRGDTMSFPKIDVTDLSRLRIVGTSLASRLKIVTAYIDRYEGIEGHIYLVVKDEEAVRGVYDILIFTSTGIYVRNNCIWLKELPKEEEKQCR